MRVSGAPLYALTPGLIKELMIKGQRNFTDKRSSLSLKDIYCAKKFNKNVAFEDENLNR
jgi:hypothetical protein